MASETPTKKGLKAKAKQNALRVGRHFQEVVIAGLTISAGVVSDNIWLIIFGFFILAATGLKELDILQKKSTKFRQNLAYGLFMVGYIGGGSNFILTFFKPEYQFKAFMGLGLLALSYVVRGYVDSIEKQSSS